jgi:hypothetical protein
MFRLKFIVFLCLAAVVSFAGCGGPGEPADRAGRAPVTVTVRYNGSPVDGATVTFHPNDPAGKGAYGMTQAGGEATLTTFPDTPGDGAMPGEYTVTVRKTKGGASGAEGDEESDSPEESEEAEPVVEDLLPVKYMDKSTTDLTATVTESGPNEITLDLAD